MSVIIPTLNAGAALEQLLDRLRRQTISPHEIIVIDSESSDGTLELAARRGATTMTVNRAEFDHGGTRNRAAAAASGAVLLFMTQDAMPADDGLIERLVAALYERENEGGEDAPMRKERESDIAIAYARQLPSSDASLLEALSREHNYPAHSRKQTLGQLDEDGLKTFFCSNVCAAIRRDLFEEMGRFQEPVIFNEDLMMAAKCILNGYSVVYCAEACVVHSHNYSAVQQFKRFFDNGVSIRLNAWLLPYSAVGGTGLKLLWSQAKGLAKRGGAHLLPKLLFDSAAKLLGFKLGLGHKRLPRFLLRRISMHPVIWGVLEQGGSRTNGNDSGLSRQVAAERAGRSTDVGASE